MQNTNRFKCKPLSAAIAASVLTLSSQSLMAQDAAPVEEVLVTGIRASLQNAMDIKRDSAGVVDAISAEDIGKFPDTNLAESLQRITGVSINRNNGEGSQITVRGWGPDFNMVTLNGRTMPVGSAYGGGSGADQTTRGGASRAFDFANIASEGVSGVEVYKTGKANITTGGIGATVNVLTARPLNTPGLNASVGGKLVHDTTNRTGDDVTPELSGIFSWTDDDAKFGVGLSASYQERDSGYTGATVNDWDVNEWGLIGGQSDFNEPYDSDVFVNAPDNGQLYTRPYDIRYTFSDRERIRTNAQLTLQYAPTDAITATVDYTFAQNEQSEHRGEVTNWVQRSPFLETVEFDNQAIATPVVITELYNQDPENSPTVRDIGYSQYYRSQEDTLDSLGLNVEWEVNDNLTLAFDVHDSTMESVPTGPGYAGEVDVGVGAPIKTGKTLYYGSDLPYWTWDTDDSIVSNGDGIIDENDLSSTVLRIWSAEQVSDVTQFKFDGMWEFDEGRFDFGIERREMSSNTTSYNGNNQQVLGGWGAAAPGEFPDGSFEPFNLVGEYSDFNTGSAPATGFRADARDLAAFLVSEYGAYVGVENNGGNTASSDTIEEDTLAAYFQVGFDGQIGNFQVNVLTGLRYEATDQTSISNTPPLARFVWQSDNDFAQESVPVDATISENDYDVLLPNLDVQVNFTDDIVARFSTSQTIARAGLASLTSAVNGFGVGGSTLLASTPRANANNPFLKPLMSTNYDLSFEWYFDDTSMASVGFFQKRVDNFVGNEDSIRTFEVRNQTAGPRAQAALLALQDGGWEVSDPALYAMISILDNPTDFPNGADDYDGTVGQQSALGEGCTTADCFIYPRDDDPLMEFEVTTPVNDDEQRKVSGMELAVQHFFGDTGFGVMANYTIVSGNTEFDVFSLEEQYALEGLSDTANMVLMYENYGVQARLAYNWRDDYLNRQNVGSGNNPGFIEDHSQFDLNVSYDITDNLSVSFEGLNITGEDRREYARNKAMLWGLEDLGARYQIGARYKF
ncbi:TonB-dependent receptor [Marinagarivorans cellulosilyticus]|uniref:TonB-dependent receptor n=1 Tax=Marinagarivorans cellulosilyticus TaxID=2721545 RepID=A0AAN2BMB8_9GAMM|nr:TonB-dependent receptor [Marinagarivorans cellulosilyticus]BCD99901.1 hypothetical protein MARGE09_P4103 [Marinagarivorans cellulosilyticus]